MTVEIKGEKNVLNKIHPYAEYDELEWVAKNDSDIELIINKPLKNLDYYKQCFGTDYELIMSLISRDQYEENLTSRLLDIPKFKEWAEVISVTSTKYRSDNKPYFVIDQFIDRIKFNYTDGVVIETNINIEEALTLTDIGNEAPCSALMLPYEFIYIRFGEGKYGIPIQPKSHIFSTSDVLDTMYIDGVYVSNVCENNNAGNRKLLINPTMRSPNSKSNYSQPYAGFGLDITDENESVSTCFNRFCNKDEFVTAGEEAKTLLSNAKKLLDHVVKIILYINSSSVRQELVKDKSHLEEKIKSLSGKKAKKLGRKLYKSYDKIIIGPKNEKSSESYNSSAVNSKKTHWRRGHFRNQAYGVNKQERKLIWIKPLLINEGSMNNNILKKEYSVS